MTEEIEEFPSLDRIRILITTDNHVGYNENDAITGDDSWRTFHEIMLMGKKYNVDMVLQGGDLFHVNKPSKKAMYQVIKTLRTCCMGEKPCELELLSDPAESFRHSDITTINYEDPNLNISIPMFSISGNHDDASGDGLLSPMDILQVSGLVNHFGKVPEADNIEITPLLFRKGKTKLALYGLASVRDERLFRTFKEGKVRFNVPADPEHDWYNIMCVHQNHTGHTNTAFLPETFLPDFLHAVIWGHEHECIPHFVHNPTKDFDVLQAGSSVATSLCDAEAQPKHVFLLEIEKDQKPSLISLPLKTVRPFIMKDISLRDFPQLKPLEKDSISQFLYEQIDTMIAEAFENSPDKEVEADNNEGRTLPLIRLRVNYSGDAGSQVDYQVENPRRFSNRFVGKVANVNNVVQFYKKKIPSLSGRKKLKLDATDVSLSGDQEVGDLQVQTLVNDFLNKMKLSLLPELGLNEAIRQFVDKDDKSALKSFIDTEISHEVDLLVNSKEISIPEDYTNVKKLLREVKNSNTVGPKTSSTWKTSKRKPVSPNVIESDEEITNPSEHVPAIKFSKPSRGNTRSLLALSHNAKENMNDSNQRRVSALKKRSYEESNDDSNLDGKALESSPDEVEVVADIDHQEINVEPDLFMMDDVPISLGGRDVVISDEEGLPVVKNKSTSKTAAASKPKIASKAKPKPASRSKATRTPKTDALSELLARRSK